MNIDKEIFDARKGFKTLLEKIDNIDNRIDKLEERIIKIENTKKEMMK